MLHNIYTFIPCSSKCTLHKHTIQAINTEEKGYPLGKQAKIVQSQRTHKMLHLSPLQYDNLYLKNQIQNIFTL
jgi:hypothetical protein